MLCDVQIYQNLDVWVNVLKEQVPTKHIHCLEGFMPPVDKGFKDL